MTVRKRFLRREYRDVDALLNAIRSWMVNTPHFDEDGDFVVVINGR